MKPLFTLSVIALFGLVFGTDSFSQDGVPFDPGVDELRIMTWNIENLGSRTPRRTDEDLQQLAQRLAGFDAAVIAVQEVSAAGGGFGTAISTVLGYMGPAWAMAGSSGNIIIYNTNNVSLESSRLLNQLRIPPFNTFYEDHADWQSEFGSNGDPFTRSRSLAFTAVFRTIDAGSGSMFRVISTHFHAGSDLSLIRQYEGLAVRRYVDNLLADPDEVQLIFVMGDFNARPETEPHIQLGDNSFLQLLEKENSQNTGILSSGANIDHVYASVSVFGKITRQSAFVVLPEHYGETPEEFEAVYSDHAPVLIDVNMRAPRGYGGSWIDIEHDNEGWVIQILEDDRVTVAWYTYDLLGNQAWMSTVGSLLDGVAHFPALIITRGGKFGTEAGSDNLEISAWGSLTITFLDCNNAIADYSSDIGFGTGQFVLSRLTGIAGQECIPD